MSSDKFIIKLSSPISNEDVSENIVKNRNNRCVFSQLYKKMNVPENYDVAKIPLLPSSSMIVNLDVEAGNTLTPSVYSYNCNTITPHKTGIYFQIQNEALEQNQEIILNSLIDEASAAIAKSEDYRGLTIALDIREGTLTESDFIGGTFATSTFTPILKIDYSTLNTGSISEIDYYSGEMHFSSSISSGTVVFTYSNMIKNNSQVVDAQSSLTTDSILTVRSLMCSNSLIPDVVLVNSNDVSLIVTAIDDRFVPVRCYTNNVAVLNGEIGQIVDLKLLSSPIVPQGNAVVIDSSRLGYNAIWHDLWSTIKKEPCFDRTDIRVWQLNNFAIADTMSVGLVCNGQ